MHKEDVYQENFISSPISLSTVETVTPMFLLLLFYFIFIPVKITCLFFLEFPGGL